MIRILKSTMAKPSRRAFAHIGLATTAFYASSSATREAGKSINKHKGNKFEEKYSALGSPTEFNQEFSTFMKDAEVEYLQLSLACNGALLGLATAMYAGASHLLEKSCCSQPPKFRFIPVIGRGMPPIPRAFAVLGAVALSPVASVLISLVSQPAVSMFHDTSTTTHSSQETESTAPYPPNQEFAPPVDSGGQQTSASNKHIQLIEATIPGYCTLFLPILEETFFRGMVFGRLLPLVGSIPAATVSAVLFGSMHKGAGGSDYLPLQETLAGLLTAWLYIRSGSLLVPMAYHCGHNVWSSLSIALYSTPELVGERWILEREFEKDDCPCRDLSLWEGIVAKNFNAINALLLKILDWFDSRALNDFPLIPLDFWGYEEELSKDSVLNKQGTKEMMETSQLRRGFRNSDGTIKDHINELFDSYLTIFFGDRDAISFTEYIDKDIELLKDAHMIHVLATNPKMVDELLRNGLPDAYRTAWTKKIRQRIGIHRLEHATEVVTRSDVKQEFEDAIDIRSLDHTTAVILIMTDLQLRGALRQ